MRRRTRARMAIDAAAAVRPYLELAEPVEHDPDGWETVRVCLEGLASWPPSEARDGARHLLSLLRGERTEGVWLAQLALLGDRARAEECGLALERARC